jgi:hypothetical protein
MNFDVDNHNFTIRFDSGDGNKSLEMNFSELFLDDILNQFRDFLRGCGYEIDGQIQVVPFDDFEYGEAIQSGQQKISEQPKFSFENIPNNNWPFGLKTEPIQALTTADIAAIKPIDLSSLNQYPTMAPLTTEQMYSWSTDMPGTLGGAKMSYR